jgi:excinuclease ABC subunit B
MEGARSQASELLPRRRGGRPASTADLKPEVLVKEIKKLEAEMFRKARNLEFEAAAALRDEIERLKQLELGFPAPSVRA